MESVALTLNIHSAKDLKDVKYFGKMDPYAVVWVAGNYGEKSEKVTTPVSRKGGCFPKWDYPIEFHIIPMKTEYTLCIKIKHDGTMRDRHIGKVEVPFADLLAPNASKAKLSYDLSRPSGRKKGAIIFSIEFSKLIANHGPGISSATYPHGRKRFGKAIKVAKKVAKIGLEVAKITVEIMLGPAGAGLC
ncbi:hypothetical protein L1887_14958 [Cichorium endivia]|nr:hypothetical protein L1887_14958 [Cichorium endivia]